MVFELFSTGAPVINEGFRNNNNNNNNNKNFNFKFENDKFAFQINTPMPNLGNLLVGALGQALFKKN